MPIARTALRGAAALLVLAASASAQAQAMYRPSAMGRPAPTRAAHHFVLRCEHVRDRAKVTNAGSETVPSGARVDVFMYEPGGGAPANGTGHTDKDVATGQSFIHPIKYSTTADHCTAEVTRMPGDIPL